MNKQKKTQPSSKVNHQVRNRLKLNLNQAASAQRSSSSTLPSIPSMSTREAQHVGNIFAKIPTTIHTEVNAFQLNEPTPDKKQNIDSQRDGLATQRPQLSKSKNDLSPAQRKPLKNTRRK